MNEWKVGDVVVCETPFIFNKKSIIRETQTTWVLDDGTKIKKGQRKPIGENRPRPSGAYSLLRCSPESQHNHLDCHRV